MKAANKAELPPEIIRTEMDQSNIVPKFGKERKLRTL